MANRRSVLCLMLLLGVHRATAGAEHDKQLLERSFWLHASLASVAQKGYWGPDYPASSAPSEAAVRNAAGLLANRYAANRLYLVYHKELPLAEAERVFCWWSRYCPKETQLVPTLVLRMYDKSQTPVFTKEELRHLCEFFRNSINPEQCAVYDIYANRDHGEALRTLADQYPGGLIRVGIQPGEQIVPPFRAAVQDTWSAFCHGKTNADWLDRGFGAETLRKWVAERNKQRDPVAWNLIVVAWDYSATERGGYPGYDDAAKNMPLPAGRNRLAVDEIMATAQTGRLSGFSSDLLILQANSQDLAHDKPEASFYETLKRGQEYRGYYSVPFREVIELFRAMKAGN